ncbi:MAG: hemolysin III family protein [Bacteroidaceae bacterium]|nr:hemolysin III family protein [Bacteroidaceae bacterium]
MAIFYTKGEEALNAWSHGAGALMAIVVGVLMLVVCGLHADGWASFGVSLYLFGMLSSYVASTLYHAWPATHRGKEVLRRWDHAAIYWHIAGSYSPLTLIALWNEGAWGVGLFIFVWVCALVGTVASFRHLREHSNAETICFVLMGLSALVAFKPLLNSIGTLSMSWIVAEGVCYITGAVFYSLHRRRYMHSLFHFFVLAGSVCHIIAVWRVLIMYLSEG